VPRRFIRPEWKQWLKALRKARALRAESMNRYSPHGEKWKANMAAHYDKRVDELEASEPEKYKAA